MNEILLVLIFMLTAVLAAAVGLKAYDVYDTNRQLAREQEELELAQVMARNEEAQNRVSEMQKEILELAEQGLGAGAIMERLGAPRELAAAYLRDAIVKNPRFSWRRLGSVVAFYSLAGLGGMIVLPATSIMAVTFMLCGALVPAMALLSLAASLVGIEVPWMVMQLGSWTMPPLMAFPVAVVVGLLLLLAGVGMWKVTVGFVRLVGEKRRSL